MEKSVGSAAHDRHRLFTHQGKSRERNFRVRSLCTRANSHPNLTSCVCCSLFCRHRCSQLRKMGASQHLSSSECACVRARRARVVSLSPSCSSCLTAPTMTAARLSSSSSACACTASSHAITPETVARHARSRRPNARGSARVTKQTAHCSSFSLQRYDLPCMSSAQLGSASPAVASWSCTSQVTLGLPWRARARVRVVSQGRGTRKSARSPTSRRRTCESVRRVSINDVS